MHEELPPYPDVWLAQSLFRGFQPRSACFERRSYAPDLSGCERYVSARQNRPLPAIPALQTEESAKRRGTNQSVHEENPYHRRRYQAARSHPALDETCTYRTLDMLPPRLDIISHTLMRTSIRCGKLETIQQEPAAEKSAAREFSVRDVEFSLGGL